MKQNILYEACVCCLLGRVVDSYYDFYFFSFTSLYKYMLTIHTLWVRCGWINCAIIVENMTPFLWRQHRLLNCATIKCIGLAMYTRTIVTFVVTIYEQWRKEDPRKCIRIWITVLRYAYKYTLYSYIFTWYIHIMWGFM